MIASKINPNDHFMRMACFHVSETSQNVLRDGPISHHGKTDCVACQVKSCEDSRVIAMAKK